MLHNTSSLDYFSLIRPIAKPRIWFYLAWIDTLSQYRRTLFGQFWILLNLIIFSVAMGSVYSGLFSIEFNKYITYLTTGMIGWQWACALFITSGSVYTSNAGLLLDYPTNKAYLLWSHVMAQLIIFIHQMPAILFFYAFGLVHVNLNMLYIIPSLILVFMINLGTAAILAIIVNRYRDLNRILNSLTIVIMMTTPIFWLATMAQGKRALVYQLNPFYYIVQIIRDPLLGNEPNFDHYAVTLFMAVLLMVVGSIVHKKYSKFVVFSL